MTASPEIIVFLFGCSMQFFFYHLGPVNLLLLEIGKAMQVAVCLFSDSILLYSVTFASSKSKYTTSKELDAI